MRLTQPWSVQVELVEGCNRLCSFCGLNAIRTAPGGYRYMSEAIAGKVASEIGALAPRARVEFAMHGEPLQHPHHAELLALFRAFLPNAQMMVTSNGRVLQNRMQQGLDRVFAAGVDFVMLDTYYPERDALRAEAATLQGITVKDFYTELAPQGWSPYANHGRKVQRFVCLMDDIGARNGEHSTRKLHNHSGSNPQGVVIADPLPKTCTKPFRELSITWNGEVRLCCEDWTGAYVCGTAAQRSLGEIWFGPEFEAARAMLQNKRRDFGACRRCDAGSGVRCGLLPKYPAVTPAVEAIVRKVER